MNIQAFGIRVGCLVFWGFIPMIICSSPDAYQTALKLLEDKMGPGNYNPDIRPVRNLSTVVTVETLYALQKIEEIDDVAQKFVVNGFFVLCWTDEILQWDPQDYNGTDLIVLQPKQMWRPRMMLMNTLDERDPFGDEISPLVVFPAGEVCWAPGSLLSVSCQLNMRKYPFDTQSCDILICSMSFFADKVEYVATADTVLESFSQSSGEWILRRTLVTSVQRWLSAGGPSSCINVNFQLDRRPEFYVMNVILPIVLLSFLNLFILHISSESGEKISYGITVLLALAVFLTMVSTMTPRSSDDTRPALSTYLFTLFVGSVLSVIVSIQAVNLQKRNMKRSYSVSTQTGNPLVHHAHHGIPREVTVGGLRNKYYPNGALPSPFSNRVSNEEVNSTRTGFNSRVEEHDDQRENGGREGKVLEFFSVHFERIAFVTLCCLWLGVNAWYAITVLY